jgi:dolichol-phosphate mannosyltransferase
MINEQIRLLTIIPTYNEIDNIERFIKTVFEYIPSNAGILVVDDNSPDGTAGVVEKIINDFPNRLHILKRPGKQGLASAYLDGFSWGINNNYNVFLEIDADFSHDPKYIPIMLEKIKDHDVVIGSRNIKEGGVEGWPITRKILSKGGSLYSRTVLGFPIHDCTGGFNMLTKNALEKINLSSIISKGYCFLIEMKYKAYISGCSIIEIPIIFVDRKYGKSKMSKKIFIEALFNIWKIKKTSSFITGLDQFLKFAITGGLGTITNLLIFFLCVDILGFNEIPVSVFCFLIAATQNYIINHKWSFARNTLSSKLTIKKWIFYILASLAGLLINISVMKLILIKFTLPYKFIAQAVGIAAGMIVNFLFSKFLIFRKKRQINNE